MRGYHDIGGLPAGRVRKVPETLEGWEPQAEIVRNLLADAGRRMTYIDELRRAYESFGAEKYKTLSFYERRVEALLYLLEGGDGYTALQQGKPLLGERDAKLIANDVMAYIAARKTVAPKVEGRIDMKM